MSGSVALTGQETLGVTTAGGVAVVVTLNQIAALIALQVAINLETIVEQATFQISQISGSGLDLSDATVTPGNVGTKASLASLIASLVPLSGGTMSGALKLSQLPVEATDAVNKSYVDNAVVAGSGDVGAAVTAAQTAAAAATAAASSVTSTSTAAITAQKGVANGLATLDASGGIVSNGGTVATVTNGLLILGPALPVTDPGVLDAVWDNGAYLCRSRGPATS